MSSESDQSSFDADRQDSRLTNIWKSIQQTKNLGSNLEKVSMGYHHGRQRQRKDESSPETQGQYKQNLAHLLKKVHQLQDENQSLQNQIEMLRVNHSEQSTNLKRQFQNRLKNHLRKMKTSQKQNVNTQSQINKVQSLTKEIDRLNLKIKSLEMEKRNQELQNNKLLELNQIYVAKIQNQNKQNALESRGQQLLELQEALQTINRLAELLRRTQEYKSLGTLLQDPKNMHYLKNVLKRFKNNQLLIKPIDKKMCSCIQSKIIPQKILWSPTQCYKILLELKMKYDYLSEDCIEEVLLEMNKIYLSKQQRALQKQKQFYQNQISKLKKQAELGYDDLLTKKQIQRLKKELRVAKSAQKSRGPVKLQVLKDKGQLSDQLKLKEREIKLLRERVRLFETENGFNDKVLYYEGTVWAIDRILNELENNQGGLKEFQVKFRERLDQNMEVEDWLRCYKEFFEALEQLNGGLIQKVLALKQTTLRKMGRLE